MSGQAAQHINNRKVSSVANVYGRVTKLFSSTLLFRQFDLFLHTLIQPASLANEVMRGLIKDECFARSLKQDVKQYLMLKL